METADILKPQEVADMLRVSRQVAYNLFDNGTLDGFKVGTQRRYYRTSVEAYMANNQNHKNVVPISTPPSNSIGFRLLRKFGCKIDAPTKRSASC